MSPFPFASSGPQHWWFLLFPLVWIVAVALLIRFVFVPGRRGCWSRGGWPGDRARGILAERYARGEIGDEEYRTRRERLRGDG
jgi:putative membrane protein